MEIQLTEKWSIVSDGTQFIVRHTETRPAMKNARNRKKGEEITAIRERYFYYLHEAVAFMAEQELRAQVPITEALARIDEIRGAVARITPRQFLSISQSPENQGDDHA